MVSHVKTTPNIDATVMQRVREEEARRGTTISALVEAGLRRLLEVEPAAAIEYNQLSGEIPAELGQLKNIDGAGLSGTNSWAAFREAFGQATSRTSVYRIARMRSEARAAWDSTSGGRHQAARPVGAGRLRLIEAGVQGRALLRR